jgi:hypothetical protein
MINEIINGILQELRKGCLNNVESFHRHLPSIFEFPLKKFNCLKKPAAQIRGVIVKIF